MRKSRVRQLKQQVRAALVARFGPNHPPITKSDVRAIKRDYVAMRAHRPRNTNQREIGLRQHVERGILKPKPQTAAQKRKAATVAAALIAAAGFGGSVKRSR